jgi:hypothetical protein
MHSSNYLASFTCTLTIFLCAHFYLYRPDHGGREPVLQLAAAAEGGGGVQVIPEPARTLFLSPISTSYYSAAVGSGTRVTKPCVRYS